MRDGRGTGGVHWHGNVVIMCCVCLHVVTRATVHHVTKQAPHHYSLRPHTTSHHSHIRALVLLRTAAATNARKSAPTQQLLTSTKQNENTGS